LNFDLDFPTAYGKPLMTADFRTVNEDFVVDEELGFTPEGRGEHQYVQLVKRGENTQWVAKQIAEFAGVKEMDVGYCGRKDRRAVTSQWFSVYMPKRPLLEWRQLAAAENLNIEILQSGLGQKKLRRGQHLGNRFQITLRNCEVSDLPALQARLAIIAAQGVPNYFGEQRFGRAGNNLMAASQWLDEGKPVHRCGAKPMLMSAARSYLFNLVLAARVQQRTWSTALEGDQLTAAEQPTGPMWGRGRSASSAAALALEQAALAPRQAWANGLEHCGLHQERRALIAKPQNFTWQYRPDLAQLELSFALNPGEYATAVLREISLLKAIDD
jgi:tRNA pseudouridine13 synthase